VSPARTCAFAVVRRVFEQGAYADRALAAEAAGMEQRERRLAMQLSYGTIQRRGTLDHVARQLVRRPLAELDPPVSAGLLLGLFQLLYLGGIAEHAAVNESVELVKRVSPGGAGLVNAVLRRAAQDGPGILAGLHDRDPAAASILHSVPQWLAELWWEELGADTARDLLRSVNQPAESVLRVNTLAIGVPEAVASLPVPSHPAPGLPEAVVLDAPFAAETSELWRQGAIMPQSRGSMLVARVLAPQGGESVLDLCAAPGGKTTHIAALMENWGSVVAVERHPGRAEALRRTCARMHAGCVRVYTADAVSPPVDDQFDRVLVDPPCSGLGTLRSRPDLRWRTSPKAIDELAALQGRILAAAARRTRPGGVLVYSVCTISKAESQQAVDAFVGRHSEFRAEDVGAEHPELSDARVGPYLQLLPHRDGTDGFFIARLRRG
jgi:16S rRNA (cytosine967-C5)-methyltransferase